MAEDQARRAGSDTNQTGDAMREAMTNAGDRMQATGKAMAESSAELGLRMLDQAEANTQAAFNAMRAAAQAGDISEVMRIQGDYLREQGSRSVSQAREIGEMIASFGKNAVGMMTRRD